MSEPTTARKYYVGLDFLKAFAAIFIVLYILFNITFGGIRRRRRRKAMRKRYDNDDYPRRHRR